MRTSILILMLLAVPCKADVISVWIRATECNHVDITNTVTTETRTYHLYDFNTDDYTEDPFVLWVRQMMDDNHVNRKRMDKFVARANLDGINVTIPDFWK